MKNRKWLLLAGVAVVVMVAIGFAVLARHWPFTRQAVVKQLREKFDGPVELKTFYSTYLPHPGCIAEGVVVRRTSDGEGPPLITIQKLTIEGAYGRILTGSKHVDTVKAEGLHVTISRRPARTSAKQDDRKKSRAVIGELIANGALVEVLPKQPGEPSLRFEVHQATLRNVGSEQPISFRAAVRNPEPPGEITATGQIGPWRNDALGEAPLSGSYTFTHADLGVFKGIAGILAAQGKFTGVLDRIDVQDATDIPNFQLTRSHHPIDLKTEFHAVVDGTTGNVVLRRADSHFRRTTIISEGDIAGKPGHGKTVSLVMSARDGRIQDLLHLFLKPPRSAMDGVISLKAKVMVPPEKRPFIEKLRLEGDFGIADARFTSANTQNRVDQLSERARGEKDVEVPENVISDLKGHVVLRNGTATLSHLSVAVPGAVANLDGTYSLLSHQINLHGTLRMDVKLSQTTKGIKSFMKKFVDPFYKKKDGTKGAVVPVKMTGIYPHPSVGLDLFSKK